MKNLHVTSALESDWSKIIKCIERYFVKFAIFSHSKHDFKSELHCTLIKFTNLRLVKFLKTLNLMNFIEVRIKSNQVENKRNIHFKKELSIFLSFVKRINIFMFE
jgi:hypothetical protein